MSDFDDFSDMAESAEPRGAAGEAQPTMWVRAPCKNAIEAQIVEMADAESLLQVDVEFVEIDAEPEPQVEMDPALSAVIGDIADAFLRHEALARSLGERGTYQDYVAACQREGMTPLKLKEM
jgi:hypothetical protein